MLVISAAEVEALLPIPVAIAAMRRAMIQVSERSVVLPLRQFMAIPRFGGQAGGDAWLYRDPPLFGVKTVAKYAHPPGSPARQPCRDRPAFRCQYRLAAGDHRRRQPDGDPHRGGFGAGDRCAGAARGIAAGPCWGRGNRPRRHVVAMLAVRPIAHVTVWGRSAAAAAGFAAGLPVSATSAATVAEAVAEAEIVCTTTAAVDPILFGAMLRPGTHVNLVGSAVPTTAEADGALVAASEFYVDYREAALAQAGELRGAIDAGLVGPDHIRGEIGELLLGQAPGRSGVDAITVYKSLGVTAQDLAAADVVLRGARAAGKGRKSC